jgi:uncharacterized membrane protein YphA (DoxX/SURF4 family)
MTIASWLLAFVFVASGLAKLAGAEMVVQQFQGWGYPRWFVDVVGIGEVVGGLLLLVPSVRVLGALALTIIMIGATGTHIMAGEWASVALPVVLLALLVWITRRATTERRDREYTAGEEIHVAP